LSQLIKQIILLFSLATATAQETATVTGLEPAKVMVVPERMEAMAQETAKVTAEWVLETAKVTDPEPVIVVRI
jgi:hypothetical protein